MGKMILEMRGIGMSFGSTRALEDVSFDLQAGEVHVLAGENGAGKSTLIKILGGVYSRFEGQLLLDDNEARFRSPIDALRRGIAVIHQELALVPSMTVADNLFLGREKTLAGGRRGKLLRAAALLQKLQLEMDPEQLVEELPLAAQQMIEIARAVDADIRVLVMDEPTSALDDQDARRLFALVEQLKASGCAIVFITHRMDEVYRLADRITVLRDGRWVCTKSRDELPRDALVQAMVGRVLNLRLPVRTESVRGDELLRVNHLSLAAGSVCLNDVSLRLHAGELVGLAGMRGAGAGELLQGLFGVYGRETAGRIYFRGVEFSRRDPASSIRKGVILLTSDRKNAGIIPGMSVRGNIALPQLARLARFGAVDRVRERALAKDAVDRFSIRCAGDGQAIEELSGGNQQKVLLARWLATEPEVLLLDEPTRGVDIGARQEIYAFIRSWTERGAGVLFATSDMEELLALSDRIIVFHRGVITAEYTREEATQEKVLQAAMGAVAMERAS